MYRHRRVISILERGLIDEIDLHIAPVLLGAGIRLFAKPGAAPIRLELLNGEDHSAAVNVRYHPVATQWIKASCSARWLVDQPSWVNA